MRAEGVGEFVEDIGAVGHGGLRDREASITRAEEQIRACYCGDGGRAAACFFGSADLSVVYR